MTVPLLVVFSTILLSLSLGQDYCQKELCTTPTPGVNFTHIGCNNNKRFSHICPTNARVVDITSFKTLILDEHNKNRNTIAGGNLPGYRPAVRMRELTWNDELSSLAELNVRSCKMEHDQCRNTARFKYSGQNLAYSNSTGILDPPATVKKMIDAWFDEYTHANMSIIDKYRSHSGPQIGHFTAMVTDRTTQTGCGMVQYEANGYFNLLLACNYDSTNLIDYPIYKSGITGSECKIPRSTKYTSLCSEGENIDPNEVIH